MDETKKFLFDILESINSIEEYLKNNKDFNTYKENKMLRRAVERELEIIGEAVNNIDKISPDIAITSKRQMVNLRNRVIHGYDKTDDEIVWGILYRHLPLHKTEVSILLK
jgi:uncharacterized protein with HEPN domain